MKLIELSYTVFVSYERINACEVVKKDDDCHYVKWYTEDGEFMSDAFTGAVSARNHIQKINDAIIKAGQTEFGFGGDDD